MLQVASRRVAALRGVFRASGSMIHRRSFAESSLSDEFEIVENMRTFPLFSQKVNVREWGVCVDLVRGKQGNEAEVLPRFRVDEDVRFSRFQPGRHCAC